MSIDMRADWISCSCELEPMITWFWREAVWEVDRTCTWDDHRRTVRKRQTAQERRVVDDLLVGRVERVQLQMLLAVVLVENDESNHLPRRRKELNVANPQLRNVNVEGAERHVKLVRQRNDLHSSNDRSTHLHRTHIHVKQANPIRWIHDTDPIAVDVKDA